MTPPIVVDRVRFAASTTMAASSTTSVRLVAAKRVPGEEGIWVLIFGDLLMFAAFFATYLYYRGQQHAVFAAYEPKLNRSYGLIDTLLLVTSSLFVSVGVGSIRSVEVAVRRLGRPAFGAALLCALGFVGMKLLEWGDLIHSRATPQTNTFFMCYFVLTGAHLFHLLIGLGVLVFLATQAHGESLPPRRLALVEGGACFWHMVDLLWIVLFALLYLAR